MDARPYHPPDRDACLALLRERAPAQEPDFAAYLISEPTGFFLLEHAGELLACGGIQHSSPEADELVWGMVRPQWERQGVGRYLLLLRTRQARAPFLDVTVPQAYAAFYEKAGFRRQSESSSPAESSNQVQLRKKLSVCP